MVSAIDQGRMIHILFLKCISMYTT